MNGQARDLARSPMIFRNILLWRWLHSIHPFLSSRFNSESPCWLAECKFGRLFVDNAGMSLLDHQSVQIFLFDLFLL